MKQSLIAVAFLFLTFLSFSQETKVSINETLEKDTSYLVTGLRYNLFSSPINKFQSHLTSNDFAKLNEYAYSFEWYIKTVRSKSAWGGTSSFGFYQRLTTNRQAQNQVSMIGFTSSFETGYNITKGNVLMVKPFLGVGFEYYKLSFVENLQSSSLSYIQTSDFKNYNATSLQVPGMIGLEFGTSIQLKQVFIEAVLRSGYKLHLDTDKWKIDDVIEIQDEINLSSPFVGFSIGVSLLKRKKLFY